MITKALSLRSQSRCELCSSTANISMYPVPPKTENNMDNSVVMCEVCLSQINGETELDINHWRCLTDSMWSEHQAIQVIAWRMLTRLNTETWAQDALEMLYIDDQTHHWAQQTMTVEENLIHKDSNGSVLKTGDNVVLTKDLNVKGSSFQH